MKKELSLGGILWIIVDNETNLNKMYINVNKMPLNKILYTEKTISSEQFGKSLN